MSYYAVLEMYVCGIPANYRALGVPHMTYYKPEALPHATPAQFTCWEVFN